MDDAAVLAALDGAEATRAEGRLGDARRILDNVLSIAPDHRLALEARLSLAREENDFAAAASARRRLIPLLSGDEERLTSFLALADDALDAAAQALSQAATLSTEPRSLLEKLQAVKVAGGRWAEAVDIAVAIAEHTPSPAERARAMVSAAEMCATHVGNTERSVALYEAAMADDPQVAGAFEAIETVLLFAEDFLGLEKAYIRQLQRLAELGATHAELTLLRKLAALREAHLDDRAGAIASLDRLLLQRPSDVESRTKLAELLEAGGEPALAMRCFEIAAQHDPLRLATFRSLSRITRESGDLDRAFAVASVLVHFGEADEDEQEIYQHHAPQTALSPARPLDDSDWQLLFPETHDRELTALVRVLAAPAGAARIAQLHAAKKLPALDASERQDPDRTTLTAVRAVAWASRFLGAAMPEIYVRNQDVAGGLLGLPTGGNVVLIGKSLLSGRAVPELTFAAARDIAFRGATAHLTTYFPTVAEVRAVILAGMSIVLPSLATTPDVASFRDLLAARLDGKSREALTAAVHAVTSRGPSIDVVGWMRSIETTACRAGLLAMGDLAAAAHMLAVDGRTIAGWSGADRVRALIPFAVSETYAGMRASLGIALRSPLS